MKNASSLLLLLIASAPAFGGLGGAATPVVTSPSSSMMVVRRAVPARSYTVQDIKTEDGTVVREYVSADNTVFGVAWNGPIMPDLKQMFGDYFTTFQREVTSRRAARGALRIDRSDLVVQSGGHQRAFSGRAYVPKLLPSGVTPEEIK